MESSGRQSQSHFNGSSSRLPAQFPASRISSVLGPTCPLSSYPRFPPARVSSVRVRGSLLLRVSPATQDLFWFEPLAYAVPAAGELGQRFREAGAGARTSASASGADSTPLQARARLRRLGRGEQRGRSRRRRGLRQRLEAEVAEAEAAARGSWPGPRGPPSPPQRPEPDARSPRPQRDLR